MNETNATVQDTDLGYYLDLMRERLSNPSAWIQWDWARDAYNMVVDPTSPEACKWCLNGSIINVTFGNPRARHRLLYLMNAVIYGPTIYMGIPAGYYAPDINRIANFNDNPRTDHKMVMDVIDRAIVVAKSDKFSVIETLNKSVKLGY